MWVSTKAAVLLILCVLLFCPVQARATDNPLQRFEEKVTRFVLENGLKFLVIERHKAPVVSFVSFVDAGSVNEPRGLTGMAHVLEHMAFKGTQKIGTRNWEKEQPLLEKRDELYNRWWREKNRQDPDQRRLRNLWAEFEKTRNKAAEYVLTNEYSKIYEQNGGVNLNAATSTDSTMYQVSLPSNRVELWFWLESDRLRHPVWRELHTEKQVVREERRMRVESDPVGALLEEVLALSYKAHPYQHPVIGWDSDILALRATDLTRFLQTYYVPQNITIAIAGDVEPSRIKALAEEYFSQLPSGSPPLPVSTQEPEQKGERTVRMFSEHQPVYVQAYQTVDQMHPDAPVLQILADILAYGRTSRLYGELVLRQELAADVSVFYGYPGRKYPALFLVYALPNRGVSLETLARALEEELKRVKDQGVNPEEVDRARTKARADLIRRLDSNLGLAKSLARAEAQKGDWRDPFLYLQELERVSAQDVRETARKYLQPGKRSVGMIVDSEKSKEEPHAK